MALPTHGLQAFGRNTSNEGHFTLEAESVSRFYLASHCTGASEASGPLLIIHALQVGQIFSKVIGNERHFSREA
jgi:hypothetical protein